MTITNCFVLIAEDSPTLSGMVPARREGRSSVARIHYDLLSQHPYEYDLETFAFLAHCLSHGRQPTHSEKAEFTRKPVSCLRSSPLTKAYGWGAHYDWAGRIAIYPADGIAYRKLSSDPTLTLEQAFLNRNSSPEVRRDAPAPRHEALNSVA